MGPRRTNRIASSWRTRLRLALTVLLAAALLASCNIAPTLSPIPSVSLTPTVAPTPTTAPSPTPGDESVAYEMTMVQDLVLIAPRDRDLLDTWKAAGQPYVWALSDDATRWNPLEVSVLRVGTVSGAAKGPTDQKEPSYDVYRIRLGDRFACVVRPGTQYDLSDDVLFEALHDGSKYTMQSKDYAVFQIYDDLYAVGADDVLKRISARKLGPYDFEDPLPPMGDVYWGEWVRQPCCSRDDNKIFYLSSRDGTFFSIWVIDLDLGVEEKFSSFSADELHGVASGVLFTYGACAMISTTTGLQYAEKDDVYPSAGWIVRQAKGKMLLERGSVLFHVASGDAYWPCLSKGDVVWLKPTGTEPGALGGTLLRIDLKAQTVAQLSIGWGILFGRDAFLRTIQSNTTTWEKAVAWGLGIRMPPR